MGQYSPVLLPPCPGKGPGQYWWRPLQASPRRSFQAADGLALATDVKLICVYVDITGYLAENGEEDSPEVGVEEISANLRQHVENHLEHMRVRWTFRTPDRKPGPGDRRVRRVCRCLNHRPGTAPPYCKDEVASPGAAHGLNKIHYRQTNAGMGLQAHKPRIGRILRQYFGKMRPLLILLQQDQSNQ